MFKLASRLSARPGAFQTIPRSSALYPRRLLSTASPPQNSRSWKNLGVRLVMAGAVIHFYNNTEAFAEEPQKIAHLLTETEAESEALPTIESLSSDRQKRKAVQAHLDAQKQEEEAANDRYNTTPAIQAQKGAEKLEEEADQQSAFNPETGEINWDCPCLGGMAHGPCGEEFKTAFSCFVYSKEEPKGMDCIENFKNMQNCFRQYPEVYGSELDSDAEDADEVRDDTAPAHQETVAGTSDSSPPVPSSSRPQPRPAQQLSSSSSSSAKEETSGMSDESSPDPPLPKASSSLVPDNYKIAAKDSKR